MTRSRGEIRRPQSPKVTSSTLASQEGMKPAYSPRASPEAYSPHMKELRSTRLKVKGIEIRQTPSPGPSILGQSSHSSPSG